MDAGTGGVREIEFTSNRQGDGPLPPDLLAQILPDEPIDTVTADGASYTRRCNGAIIGRSAIAFGHSSGPVAVMPALPFRRNGRARKDDCPVTIPRNDIMRVTRQLGRSLWKKWAGYYIRSRVEARMNCLKLSGAEIGDNLDLSPSEDLAAAHDGDADQDLGGLASGIS